MIFSELTFSNVRNNHLLYNDDRGLKLHSGHVPSMLLVGS